MKNILKKIKDWIKNIKKAFTWLKSLFKNTLGLFKNLWHLVGSTDNVKIFYGFFHFDLAKKYAHKRYDKYPVTLDQKGKNQGVFAYGDESLIVISAKEIKLLKKRGVIDNPKWYRKIFNRDNIYKVA
jgi:hypothetical protein